MFDIYIGKELATLIDPNLRDLSSLANEVNSYLIGYGVICH